MGSVFEVDGGDGPGPKMEGLEGGAKIDEGVLAGRENRICVLRESVSFDSTSLASPIASDRLRGNSLVATPETNY
jgi:hypothetical protein